MRIFFIIILVQCCSVAISQGNIGANIDADLSQVSNIKVYALKSFDTRDKSIKGSSLLFNDWTPASIHFNRENLPDKKDFILNYDIQTNELLVRSEGQIMVIPLEIIDIIEVDVAKDSKYEINSYVSLDIGNGSERIFEVLEDGEFQLLKSFSTKIIKGLYNAALDVGSVKSKIVIENEYYVYHNQTLYKLDKKKKKMESVFQKLKPLGKFYKKNSYKSKDEKKLCQDFKQINNNL